MEKTFIGLLTKDGKKERAQNIFYTSVSKVAKKHKISVHELLQRVFEKIEPVLNYSILKRGASNYVYPKRITSWRAKSLSVKWVVQSARLRSEKGFASRFEGELNDLLAGKAKSLNKRLDFQKRAVSNRFVLRNFWTRNPKYHSRKYFIKASEHASHLSRFNSED